MARLFDIGEGGLAWHVFGERADAHHIKHANAGGTGQLANCIILCRSCHYSVHGGGTFTVNSGTMQGRQSDYVCYDGNSNACGKLAAELDKRFNTSPNAPSFPGNR
ncbi:MAG: HNH endonuclease [Hyphomicrobiales bacterium]